MTQIRLGTVWRRLAELWARLGQVERQGQEERPWQEAVLSLVSEAQRYLQLQA